MAHKQGLRFRILQVTMAVVRISSLLLLIHLASLFGFQRNRTSSRPGVMLPNKVPGPISRMGIARRGTTTTELLGGAIATKSAQQMIGLTEILGGTKTRPNGIGTIGLGGHDKIVL